MLELGAFVWIGMASGIVNHGGDREASPLLAEDDPPLTGGLIIILMSVPGKLSPRCSLFRSRDIESEVRSRYPTAQPHVL